MGVWCGVGPRSRAALSCFRAHTPCHTQGPHTNLQSAGNHACSIKLAGVVVLCFCAARMLRAVAGASMLPGVHACGLCRRHAAVILVVLLLTRVLWCHRSCDAVRQHVCVVVWRVSGSAGVVLLCPVGHRALCASCWLLVMCEVGANDGRAGRRTRRQPGHDCSQRDHCHSGNTTQWPSSYSGRSHVAVQVAPNTTKHASCAPTTPSRASCHQRSNAVGRTARRLQGRAEKPDRMWPWDEYSTHRR
jgi:hypothetical protein